MDISSWFCLVKTFITYTLRNSAVLFFIWPRFVDFFYIRTEELCRHTGDPLCVYPLLIKLKCRQRLVKADTFYLTCTFSAVACPHAMLTLKEDPFLLDNLTKRHITLLFLINEVCLTDIFLLKSYPHRLWRYLVYPVPFHNVYSC